MFPNFLSAYDYGGFKNATPDLSVFIGLDTGVVVVRDKTNDATAFQMNGASVSFVNVTQGPWITCYAVR